jgi:hypothetical protein
MSQTDKFEEWNRRAMAAQGAAAHAFNRLLQLAETRNSGQVRRVAGILASLYNGTAFPLDPYELRALSVGIADDCIACLDALRWGKADLHTLVPDGAKRIEAVITRWGLKWPN